MNASTALSQLKKLGVPAVETAEAAVVLGQSVFAASKTMARLAAVGAILRVRSGTWWLSDDRNPLRIASCIVMPYPSYVSLHTALREHGMIAQLPGVIYLVSLARAQRVRTSIGTVSIHHVTPELFCDYEEVNGILIASPEKALFDLAYVSGGRSSMRARLPEIELPRRFRKRRLEELLKRIPSARKRTLTAAKLRSLLV